MIVYADASALVKRYVLEAGSRQFDDLAVRAEVVGTGIVSRIEVTAALGRAARMAIVTRADAETARRQFEQDWAALVRLPANEPLAARAAALAWECGLRGFDALHLATALGWREAVDADVVLATYDRELWRAGEAWGLAVWPEAI